MEEIDIYTEDNSKIISVLANAITTSRVGQVRKFLYLI